MVEVGCKHAFHKECIALRFSSNGRNCAMIEIRDDGSTRTVENRSVSCLLCRTRILRRPNYALIRTCVSEESRNSTRMGVNAAIQAI